MKNKKEQNPKTTAKTKLPKEKQLTELVFILDRSGSMSGLETDTIGGYNNLLKEQKNSGEEATVTTVLFDDKYELLHENEKISNIKPITTKEYFARGSTALLDAIGKTISDKRTALDLADKKPGKVLVVIITDGFENASREYSLQKVKNLIEAQKKSGNWEFMFLGANIDAIATAREYGIDENNAVRYECDSKGLKTSYKAVSSSIKMCMRTGKISPDWKRKIEEDLKARKNRTR